MAEGEKRPESELNSIITLSFGASLFSAALGMGPWRAIGWLAVTFGF